MATRMQQRRGTAAQWISTNTGNGPILNAGEIGYETDTNKFKIGDGTNHWINLDYFVDANSTVNPAFGSSITFEGATDNAFETTLSITDPTADRTITFPDATGTVVLADGSGNVTVSGDLTVSGTTTTINSTTINATTGIIFEGATADAFETTLTVTDPTADRTITFPDATGTVALTSALSSYAPLASPTFTGTVTLPANTISQSMMNDDSVGTNEIGGLAVTTGKLADGAVTTIKITDANVTAAKLAADSVETAKIVDSAVTSAKIANDTIVNADINSAAAIALSKLATDPLARANHTGSQTASTISDFNEAAQDAIGGILGTGLTYNDASNTITVDSTNIQLRVTGVTDTEIGYLDGVTSAIQTQIDTKLASATASTTYAPLASPALTGTATAVNLTISGDLTVNGTTTNLNSTSLVVEDKNIVLGDTGTPTDTTADGGGITLKGATDKTFNWVDATDAWTSSENMNLLTGKVYEIAGTTVLSGSTLGSGVTGSSLTSVGTIATGVWNGTTIAIANGGTGATTASTAAAALLPSQTSNSGKYLTTDGSGTLSWGTVSGYSAPTLGSTSIASGATVTTIAGLTKITAATYAKLDANSYEQDFDLLTIMGAI